MTTIPSMGIPRPVDADWQEIQEQIDAVVHEHDSPPEPDDHKEGPSQAKRQTP